MIHSSLSNEIKNSKRALECPVELSPLVFAVRLEPCAHRVNQAVAEILMKDKKEGNIVSKVCPLCCQQISHYSIDQETRKAAEEMTGLYQEYKWQKKWNAIEQHFNSSSFSMTWQEEIDYFLFSLVSKSSQTLIESIEYIQTQESFVLTLYYLSKDLSNEWNSVLSTRQRDAFSIYNDAGKIKEIFYSLFSKGIISNEDLNKLEVMISHHSCKESEK